MGGASHASKMLFISTPKLNDVGKDAQDHAFKNSVVFDDAASFVCCFQVIILKEAGLQRRRRILFGLECFCTLCCSNPIADLTKLGDNVST